MFFFWLDGGVELTCLPLVLLVLTTCCCSPEKELRCWMDAINTAASLLSAPPLPAPVGSQQRFQRPLLPATLSKLPARDQLLDHDERVQRLEQELREHRANPPPPNAKSALANVYREKDAFLHFEVGLHFAFHFFFPN